jgi:cysteine desulfurase
MPCRVKKEQDFKVRQFVVSENGVVDLDSVQELISDDTAIVSLQAANNETGVIQPIQEVADIAHSKGALLHCDATQWIAKLPIPAWFQSCDFLSISAHKCYGPKGIGVLVTRRGMPRRSLMPIMHGGGQGFGLRSGTPNVPGIVGFGEACRLAMERVVKDEVSVRKVRHRFEDAVTTALPRAWINGNSENRLPGTTSLTIPDVPASMLVSGLANICIGEGSACTTGASDPSHVLVAMGLSREHADNTVRISFGRQNTIEDADVAARSISKAVALILEDLRMKSGPTALPSSGGNNGS